MEIKPLLKQLWANPWLKKIPAKSLYATLVATILHPALLAVGFELPVAGEALAKIGFALGPDILDKLGGTLLQAAKSGVAALAEWLEKKLAEEPEINQAAAEMTAKTAEPVAQSLQEERPDDKEQVAGVVGEGMKDFGDATQAIADSYTAILKDVRELSKRVEEMQASLKAISEQSMIARQNSAILRSRQEAEREGVQKMRAEDNSRIEDSQQVLTTKPKKNNLTAC